MLLRSLDQIPHGELALAGLPGASIPRRVRLESRRHERLRLPQLWRHPRRLHRRPPPPPTLTKLASTPFVHRRCLLLAPTAHRMFGPAPAGGAPAPPRPPPANPPSPPGRCRPRPPLEPPAMKAPATRNPKAPLPRPPPRDHEPAGEVGGSAGWDNLSCCMLAASGRRTGPGRLGPSAEELLAGHSFAAPSLQRPGCLCLHHPPAGGWGAGAGAPRLACLVRALGGSAEHTLAPAPADFLFHTASTIQEPDHVLDALTVSPRILEKGHRNSLSARRRTVNIRFKRLDRAPQSPTAIRLS